MKDGNEIEYGNRKTIFEKPRNTYTKKFNKIGFFIVDYFDISF